MKPANFSWWLARTQLIGIMRGNSTRMRKLMSEIDRLLKVMILLATKPATLYSEAA